LDADNFIDFSLMIRLVVDALNKGDARGTEIARGIRHLMVDEYQDVNPAQEQLIREIHRFGGSLFVVGDDDQAIYAWRGADVNNILDFGHEYPNAAQYTLPKNYRSISPIVSAADAFVAAELGATRIPKHPQADEPAGAKDFRKLWFGTREDEAEWMAERIAQLVGAEYHEPNGGTPRGLTYADFAVLMRSTRSKEQDGTPRHKRFTDALVTRGIPFTLEAGGSIFDRPQVGMLRRTLELLREGTPDREAAKRHFDDLVLPVYPDADFEEFARVLAEWGRRIHAPVDFGAVRRRVLPQQLVHELLHAFGIQRMIERGIQGGDLDEGIVADLGVFSRIFQDVEAVYVSVDTRQRFVEILNFLANVAETGYDTSEQALVARPNAVFVSTVHKAKGLEFPVVFLADVEAQRFPSREHGYDGWLPEQVLREALRRGRYQNRRTAEARLFYTAMTRAGRCLYITGASVLPGGARERKRSEFFLRLSGPGLSGSPRGLPEFQRLEPARGTDESLLPTTFSDLKYYLFCPADYWFRKRLGFSPPIPEMFGFGQTVHASVGKLHEMFKEGEPTPEQAGEVAGEIFHLKHVPPSSDPDERPGPYERARSKAKEIVARYAGEFVEDFRYKRQVEIPFEVPIKRAVIAGAIDLLLEYDGEGDLVDATVIDFKTVARGPEEERPEHFDWTEFSLQVQLYAHAAVEVLGKNARTGKVHFLRDSKRVDVPISDEAERAALDTVEWAVDRIVASDFPMRPHPDKCNGLRDKRPCDWAKICPKVAREFTGGDAPPAIAVPAPDKELAILAFREYDPTWRPLDGGERPRPRFAGRRRPGRPGSRGPRRA
jgi:DNA helicase-2/ATP-dependent DNA helicase PcrA